MPSQRKPCRIGCERLGHVPLGVGIVDPQQELPAVLPGEQPVEQRRAHAADVQIAGRDWEQNGCGRAWGGDESMRV